MASLDGHRINEEELSLETAQTARDVLRRLESLPEFFDFSAESLDAKTKRRKILNAGRISLGLVAEQQNIERGNALACLGDLLVLLEDSPLDSRATPTDMQVIADTVEDIAGIICNSNFLNRNGPRRVESNKRSDKVERRGTGP